jgi:hypothetical protein
MKNDRILSSVFEELIERYKMTVQTRSNSEEGKQLTTIVLYFV